MQGLLILQLKLLGVLNRVGHVYLEAMPEVVKEVRRLRRKPKDGSRRKTYREIAGILNERGVKTRKGKEFTQQIVAGILCRC